MRRTLLILGALLAMTGGIAAAQDLKVDSLLDMAPGSTGSYFTFAGPIRFMSADKDHVDAASGASAKKSTALFQPYRYDVKGKNALPDALRGLFLYSVAPAALREDDNLSIARAGDGTITVRFSHRGTAYELVTDKTGKLLFPDGACRKRAIGYIQGEGPQVISRDFSADGSAAKIDWKKVWDEKIPAGREITAGNPAKTGAVTPDTAVPEAMFAWEGTLQVSWEKNVLKISGGLNAVKR